MKVGDLVTRSAYGKKVKRSKWVEDNDIGIIVKLVPWGHSFLEYKVRWVKSDYNTKNKNSSIAESYYWSENLPRKDLRYVK